jgi:uncharacterized protein (DUF302 family)
MNNLRRTAAVASALVVAFATFAAQAAEGMVSRKSGGSVAETIQRFEAAIGSRGFAVFARIDHAAAAKAAGLEMPAATQIVFGNPRAGTPAFLQQPTLAIDLPLKALVWQDAQGAVWLGWNSAAYVFGTIYPRHGLQVGAEARERAEAALAAAAEEATR